MQWRCSPGGGRPQRPGRRPESASSPGRLLVGLKAFISVVQQGRRLVYDVGWLGWDWAEPAGTGSRVVSPS
jgi:hypothetical protein